MTQKEPITIDWLSDMVRSGRTPLGGGQAGFVSFWRLMRAVKVLILYLSNSIQGGCCATQGKHGELCLLYA